MSKFELYLKETKEVHALIMKPLLSKEVDKAVEVLEAIKSLLLESQEVIPDELPDELPFMCDIQYQIDLIPGANLLNLPHITEWAQKRGRSWGRKLKNS